MLQIIYENTIDKVNVLVNDRNLEKQISCQGVKQNKKQNKKVSMKLK